MIEITQKQKDEIWSHVWDQFAKMQMNGDNRDRINYAVFKPVRVMFEPSTEPPEYEEPWVLVFRKKYFSNGIVTNFTVHCETEYRIIAD